MAVKNKHVDPRQCVRRIGKEPVKPVLYNGRGVGHGKYLTGEVNGDIILDANGVPLRLRQIGELISHEKFEIMYPTVTK
jgi:flavin-dependent dehydrogenase